MSRLFYATLLTLTLACSAAVAQTRRGTAATPARPKPAATPAQTTPKPAPTPAAAPTQPQPAGGSVEDCGCEAGPVPEVLGTVNGVKITRSDLSQQVQQQVAQLQQEVVEARKRELDLQINSILLDAEAKKRNTTSAKLVEAEIINKATEPTAAEAEAYFNQNRAAIEQQAGRSVAFAEAKDSVTDYLRDQRQQELAGKFAETLRAAAQVKRNVEFATPPATPADRARVFATVNGKNITSGDIEDALVPIIASVQDQVYLLRKGDVDMKINDILLNGEAQKRGITAQAVLAAEVTAKTPTINEAQAQEFFNKNKERIGAPDFATVKYQIIDYLQQQEQQKLESAFVERLRNGASVQTFITPPVPPVFQIATDDQPTKGKADASVTVVEFTDYQCPSCAAAQPILEKLITEYGDRVRFVIRDFPLQMHPEARKAAEAAEAAREQGKYWDFTAILFRNQSALKPEQLKQYAQVIGLDRAKFDAALDKGTFADKVERDMIDGQKFGVSGTPTFFVNGRRAKDASYDTLKAAIEEALKAPAAR
ncbi:MAG: DsbA family protein [Acidobacteria bacterium]|nr:DsbA family protein [Acidobacteriota bacterium]MBV9925796.1 DsbA family protein [Acidobacteriota bacterium]